MKHDIHVIFEDANIIVINKTAGLLSIPDRYDSSKINAFDLLHASYSELYVVHRIDKDTSGILVFCKRKESHRILNSEFENHNVDKSYLCIAESIPAEAKGIINKPISHSTSQTGKMVIHPKGKESITHYKLLEKFRNFSMILASPVTGRTHQIRVHLASIGCPLVCDPLYGLRSEISISDIKRHAYISPDQESHPLLARTALHSWKLNFRLQEQEYAFEAEIPKDMNALYKQLKKWAPFR